MTLGQLRIFIAVAEREHLTRAAESLNLTQSAVSSAVSALEARYGVKLFDRIGRGISLTQAGHAFLPEARSVLARQRAAEQTLLDVSGGVRGSLRLVASQTVGNYWIAGRMAAFIAQHPGVDVHLDITNTERAAAQVLAGEADLAVVEGHVDDPRLSVRCLDGDVMRLAVPEGHPLAGARDLCAKGWAGLRFIVREPGSGTRAILHEHLAGMGLALDAGTIAMELPSNEAIRGAVQAGLGVAVLSSLVIDTATGVRWLPTGIALRSFSLVRMKERSATRAETAFAGICLQ